MDTFNSIPAPANGARGECSITLGKKPVKAVLTLRALAEIETETSLNNIASIAVRCEGLSVFALASFLAACVRAAGQADMTSGHILDINDNPTDLYKQYVALMNAYNKAHPTEDTGDEAKGTTGKT